MSNAKDMEFIATEAAPEFIKGEMLRNAELERLADLLLQGHSVFSVDGYDPGEFSAMLIGAERRAVTRLARLIVADIEARAAIAA